jgi:hypothetical protein
MSSSAAAFVPHLIGDDWVAGEPEQEHEQAAQ